MLSSRRNHEKIRPGGVLLLLCLAGPLFGAVPAPAAGAAELKAELVNKVREGWSGASLPTGQVKLTYPDSRTKLLPYRSHLQPVVADGKVCIFATKNLDITRIVVYDSASNRAQSFPLPEDLERYNYFGSPSFSPDGTKVAYYFHQEGKYEAKYGFIDRKGQAVTEPPVPRQFKSRPSWGQFSEGLAQVAETKDGDLSGRKRKTTNRKVGFEDLTGRVVIPPQFDEAGYFSEGLAPVQVGEEWGFIGKTGKTVIPPQYSNAKSFSEGLAAVNIGSKKWGFGRGRWGFIDKRGKMVIPPQYDDAGNFSEGLAWVVVDKKYGFIDQKGKMVIPLQYKAVEDFFEGFSRVKKAKDSQDEFIDYTGKEVSELTPSRQMKVRPAWGNFSEGLAQVSEPRSEGVWQLGKMGYKDVTGKVVIPPQFDEAGYFSEGLAPVEIGEKWGFIDKTGKTVIPLQYTLAHSFSEGLAAVRIGGEWGYGKWGFIDKEGKMVIPPQYDGAHSFSEGLARVAVDGKYGFIDQTGRMVIPPQYDEAGDFSQGVAKVGVGVMEWTLGGGRVRSWPDWQLLWQSPLCTPTCSDAPPLPPIWKTNSLAFFDPEFCSPPRFLKYQVSEPEKSGKEAPEKSK
jgi:hypothetical protein